jgi:hypothetical protein
MVMTWKRFLAYSITALWMGAVLYVFSFIVFVILTSLPVGALLMMAYIAFLISVFWAWEYLRTNGWWTERKKGTTWGGPK